MKNEKVMAFLKKNAVLLLVGVACAAALLLAGSFFGERDKTEPDALTQTDGDAYVAELETRLMRLLQNVAGVGKCDVLITLEAGPETVYAQAQKTTSGGTDTTYPTVGDGSAETPVVVKKNAPKIAGVAIVCEGGGSNAVRTAVLQTVSKALAIDTAKISIEKRK